ncbi:hypothetical protein M8J76_005624 [Diaphorina citri]|nr:hypothetical protein M8J76_005624 [Diaphorina citri]
MRKPRFALVVLDNANLMELWDWNKRNLSLHIQNGRIFFHFNPKLCYYHIKNLATKAGVTSLTDTEVPKSSNGDKAACNISWINATITNIQPYIVTVQWNKFDHYDSRALLSYLIFYKETNHRNVTIYDGRDACGGDGWKMEEIENADNKASSSLNETEHETTDPCIQIIPNLKPFTQYAYYVRTYTIATERNGAQSPIHFGPSGRILVNVHPVCVLCAHLYDSHGVQRRAEPHTVFLTKPNTPSVPRELIATPLSSSEIEISWKPPEKPNGNVTHYYIVGSWERDDPMIIETRNYCQEPVILTGSGGPAVTTTTVATPTTPAGGTTTPPNQLMGGDDDKCECETRYGKSEDVREKENNRRIEIEFENTLQDQVYVKSSDESDDQLVHFDHLRAGDDFWRLPDDASVARRRRRSEDAVASKFPNMSNPNQTLRSAGSDEKEDQQPYAVPSPEGNVTTPDGVFVRFEFVVYGATRFTLRNLSHFGRYNIEVQACREVVPDEFLDSTNSNCSTKSLVTRRTHAKKEFDSIEKFSVEKKNGTWYALWEAPRNPNGIIVAYKIETSRLDKSKYSDPHCISRLEYDDAGRYEIRSDLLAGNYSIRVRAVSLHGEGDWTKELYFDIEKPVISHMEVIIICFLVLILVVVLIFLGVIYYRRERAVTSLLVPSINPEYIPVYKKDSWEVLRSKVTILDELGNGSFGLVYRGLIKDFRSLAEHPCAIKVANENASEREKAEFLNEASVMKAFDTHHVVKLYGVVSEGNPTLVIMELMGGGDLKNYLRSCRPDAETDVERSPPTLSRILQMAAEVADGMAYLADKKFVHRDLAARNCMVADDLTVKVGDFGMTRDIYETEYYRKGSRGFLPVRWMAPESLKDGVFTSHSDVWSYGVVLWEMATLASQPYQGLSNEQVLNWVKGGGILVRPDNCPDRLFNLMRRCWQFKPQARPTFMEILADLERDIAASFRQVSLAAKAETRTSSTTLDEQIPLRSAEDIEDFSLSSDSNEEDNNPALEEDDRGVMKYRNNAGPPSITGSAYRLNQPTPAAATSRYSPYRDTVPTSTDSRYGSKNSTMGRSEDSRAYLDSSCPSTLGRYSDYPKEGSLGRYSDSLGRYRDAEPGSRDNIDKPGRDGQNFKNNREKRSQDLNASESELQPLNNRAGLDGESRQFSPLARPSLKSLGEGSSTHSLPVAMEIDAVARETERCVSQTNNAPSVAMKTERRVSQTNNAPSVAMTTNDLGPERNPTSGTNPKGNSATVERNPAHPGGNYAAMNYTGRNPTSTGRSSNAIAGNPANSPPLSNAIGNPAQPASLTNDIGNSATIGNATANPSSGNVANTIGNFRSIGNAIQGNSTLGNATTVPRGGPTSNFVNNLPSPGSNIGNSLTTPTSIGNSLATPTGSIGNSLATPTSIGNSLATPTSIGNSLTTPTSIGNSLATPTGSIGNSLATPTSTLLGANGHLSGGVTGGAHRRNGAAPPTNSMPC